MILKYLIEKEFKQLFRNPFLPKMILIFPVVMMILLPWAANREVKNLRLTVIDNDHSVTSERLTGKLAASDYFHLTSFTGSYKEAMEEMERGRADIILEIPPRWEERLVRGESATLQIAANAVDGTKGGLGSSYLTTIVQEYLSSLREEHPQGQSMIVTVPEVKISTFLLYNPNLSYKYFIVPALVVMLLTLLCGFLPALNIVSEKEFGTIEQINVTPVGKFTFIMAKLLPYWLIGLVVLTNCFLLAWLLYDITPVGHWALIYLFAAIYILGISGLGLVISNHSATMQQAMFVMFFFLIVLMLMSGFFTPVASMPRWAQIINWLNPLKYMMQTMRMIYLKGSGFTDLLSQWWALLGFALFFNGWAVKSYKKRA